MEKYLKEEYGVIEDLNYLKSESDIESYARDTVEFDCGQGYYEDEKEVIYKIGDKFYKVWVVAEIGSAKQDHGDRLYHVESIEDVTWEEIEKPQPLERKVYEYKLSLTEGQHMLLEEFIKKHNIY